MSLTMFHAMVLMSPFMFWFVQKFLNPYTGGPALSAQGWPTSQLPSSTIAPRTTCVTSVAVLWSELLGLRFGEAE